MTPSQVSAVLDTLPQAPFPIVRWDVDTGTDSTGSEAVWVWAVVDGDVPPVEELLTLRDQVQAAVRAAAQPPAPWVYVRMKSLKDD